MNLPVADVLQVNVDGIPHVSDEQRPSILLQTGHQPAEAPINKTVSFCPQTATRQFYSDDAPEKLIIKEIIHETKEESNHSPVRSPSQSIAPIKTIGGVANEKIVKIPEICRILCCLPFLVYTSCINLFCPCIKHITLKCCRFFAKKRRKTNHIKDVFIDSHFLPNEESLNIKELKTNDIEWLSVTEMYAKKKTKLNVENINVKNIIDGQNIQNINNIIDNKWLLSAIISLCQYPYLIKKLFLLKGEKDPCNLHRIRLFDGRAKKWKQIKIDDLIPCFSSTKKPLFNYPKSSDELWFILLEKCIAKFCGNYGNLDNETGEFLAWALHALSGRKVNVIINSANRRDSWIKGCIKYNTISSEKVINSLNVQKKQKLSANPKEQYKIHFDDAPKNYFSTRTLWFVLNRQFDDESLIVATQSSRKLFKKFELCQCENNLNVTLESDDSYNILQIKEIGCFKLIELNNSWNTFTWNGKWSNNHPIWEEHPLIFDALKPDFNQTDRFWIELSEFILLFNVIYICHRVKRINHKNDLILNVNPDTNICDASTVCCKKCFHFWCKCVSCKTMYPKVYKKWMNRSMNRKVVNQDVKSKYVSNV